MTTDGSKEHDDRSDRSDDTEAPGSDAPGGDSAGPAPELVVPGAVEAGDAPEGDAGEQVTSPTKLIRIASMVRTMLDEVRQAPLDEPGRRRLREIHDRAVAELHDVLSPDLQSELQEMVLPFSADAPSESELRLAQAQLVGWLEGLFHGIQATLFQQQASMAQQLEEMRRRAALEARSGSGSGTGQYL